MTTFCTIIGAGLLGSFVGAAFIYCRAVLPIIKGIAE